MIQQIKPASACADCRLCSRGQVCVADSGPPDIDELVQEVIRRVRPGPAPLVGVPVGVSARHCHVNRESTDILFGPGSDLTPYRHLYQPGAFAANEYISVVGPRLRAIERVRILGPMRGYNQVEFARTDSIYLGLEDPPVRDSGDLEDGLPVTFIGPKGAVTVDAAIRATRHIHLSPDDAVRMGVDGRLTVCVRVPGEKGLVFENVRLKVHESFIPEIHLDTDDANAASLACGDTVRIEP